MKRFPDPSLQGADCRTAPTLAERPPIVTPADICDDAIALLEAGWTPQGDRGPAHHPDGKRDGEEVRAEQAHQRHREKQCGQHLEELGDAHERLVDEPAVEPGGGAEGDADGHADGRGACADCEGGTPAVDDRGQHVAPREIAANWNHGRFARRRERAPYDVEGVDGIEGGHDEGRSQH